MEYSHLVGRVKGTQSIMNITRHRNNFYGLLVWSKYKGTLKKLQLKQFYGGCLPLRINIRRFAER